MDPLVSPAPAGPSPWRLAAPVPPPKNSLGEGHGALRAGWVGAVESLGNCDEPRATVVHRSGGYIFSIILRPNSLQLTLVAPSIRRSKS